MHGSAGAAAVRNLVVLAARQTTLLSYGKGALALVTQTDLKVRHTAYARVHSHTREPHKYCQPVCWDGVVAVGLPAIASATSCPDISTTQDLLPTPP